jgi:hypothetical protein
MNGIWNKENAEHHQVSPRLAMWISDYLKENNCISFCDFGCGNGYYVNHLLNNGFSGIGIEGNEKGIQFPLNVFVGDLTNKLFLKHDCSISLEVGEHLDKIYQELFMQNICISANKVLILSWAEIGQPGIGHVNCRSQQDVIEDVKKRGFDFMETPTFEARQNIDDNTDWFRRTLLIFKKCK